MYPASAEALGGELAGKRGEPLSDASAQPRGRLGLGLRLGWKRRDEPSHSVNSSLCSGEPTVG